MAFGDIGKNGLDIPNPPGPLFFTTSSLGKKVYAVVVGGNTWASVATASFRIPAAARANTGIGGRGSLQYVPVFSKRSENDNKGGTLRGKKFITGLCHIMFDMTSFRTQYPNALVNSASITIRPFFSRRSDTSTMGSGSFLLMSSSISNNPAVRPDVSAGAKSMGGFKNGRYAPRAYSDTMLYNSASYVVAASDNNFDFRYDIPLNKNAKRDLAATTAAAPYFKVTFIDRHLWDALIELSGSNSDSTLIANANSYAPTDEDNSIMFWLPDSQRYLNDGSNSNNYATNNVLRLSMSFWPTDAGKCCPDEKPREILSDYSINKQAVVNCEYTSQACAVPYGKVVPGPLNQGGPAGNRRPYTVGRSAPRVFTRDRKYEISRKADDKAAKETRREEDKKKAEEE